MNKKSVLITASSSGLGRELSLVFAKNNYNVIIHGRDMSKILDTKKELLNIGAGVSIVQGDLRNISTLDDLFKKAKEHDISVLVNNAAVPCPGLPLEKLDDEQIKEILYTNLISPLLLTKRIYNLFLEKNNGAIVNINSIIALEPKKFRTIHSSAKYGMHGFSEVLRLESEEKNINVLEVYLTRTRTHPNYEFGMDSEFVAQQIYNSLSNTKLKELIIDGRPEQYRTKKYKSSKNRLVIDGRANSR